MASVTVGRHVANCKNHIYIIQYNVYSGSCSYKEASLDTIGPGARGSQQEA